MAVNIKIDLPESLGRTVATPIPGTGTWWDNVEKTKHGWPVVICFDTKADREDFAKWLKGY